MKRSRMFFLLRLGSGVNDAITIALADRGLDDRLGSALFAPSNRHQSVSNLHVGEHALRAALSRAGDRVQASAFELVFNRIGSKIRPDGRIQWTLLGRGKPRGFSDLLRAIAQALVAEGIIDATEKDDSHTVHITLSYNAPEMLKDILWIDPIVFTVDAFELVEAHKDGDDYWYETIARWSLQPPLQAGLF